MPGCGHASDKAQDGDVNRDMCKNLNIHQDHCNSNVYHIKITEISVTFFIQEAQHYSCCAIHIYFYV